MEIWDAYNCNFEKIEGLTLVRGEEAKIPEGVFHLVNQILVRHADGTYLLMKRAPCKAHPNMWEPSAGGSALKGETALESAFRELREETGIVATELQELEWTVNPKTHSIHVKYLCVTDCDKNSVQLQEGETCDFKWATAEEILSMPDSEIISWQMMKFIKPDFSLNS